MKKKSKAARVIRNIFLFIFILIAFGAVFYFGYYQFQLPVDNYAVLFSKINKWDPVVVEPGKFRFEWEALIPYNLKIETFEIKPIKKSLSLSGILPSAEVYSAYLTAKPDFSYKISLDVNYVINPEKLPQLCEEKYLRRESYQDILKDFENIFVSEAYTYIRKRLKDDSTIEEADYNYQLLTEELKSYLSKKYPYIIFIDFVATDISLPDIELYKSGRKQYFEMEEYLEKVRMASLKETETKMIKEQSNLDILKKYGEVFKEYPNLVQYFALVKDGDTGILPELNLPSDQ